MKKFFSMVMILSFLFVSCVKDDEDEKTEEKDDSTQNEVTDKDSVDLIDDSKDGKENDETVAVNDDENGDVVIPDDDVNEIEDEDVSQTDFCTDFATVFPLQNGDCVPDFTLPAQDGVTMVTLSDYRGKYVLFSSFPMANTSVCTGQMQKLDEMYNDFIAENIMPFGFNNESPEKKENWCETMGIVDLLILADHNPKDAVSIMFGINGFATARANTVIGPDGRFIMKKSCANSSCIPAILEDIKNLK